MPRNASLNKAKDEKHCEYYTRIEYIEEELRHYKKHFKDKVIFCNCDDPEYSNFWKYFDLKFDDLKLKKLISTHFETEKPSYKLEKIRKSNGETEIIKTPLRQNGDFRSPECIEILQEADIVITNPPYPLFREYIDQLMQYNKKFLIIGNSNALHYKEVFPLVKNNKVWVGYKSLSTDMLFNVSKEFGEWLVQNKKKGSGYRIIDGEVKGRAQAIWFTNLDIDKRHEELLLYKQYNEAEYLHYDNFDAIDVKNVRDIPMDYYGIMGVPDSFLENYNPNQFELLGLSTGDSAKEIGVQKNYRGRTDLAFTENGKHKCPFSRILIRRKEQ